MLGLVVVATRPLGTICIRQSATRCRISPTLPSLPFLLLILNPSSMIRTTVSVKPIPNTSVMGGVLPILWTFGEVDHITPSGVFKAQCLPTAFPSTFSRFSIHDVRWKPPIQHCSCMSQPTNSLPPDGGD